MGGRGLNTDFGFGTLVTFVFRILLFGIFVIELIFCFEKFLCPNTTDVTKLDYVQTLDVPSITLCRQGYRNFNVTGLENELLVTFDSLCLDIMRSVIPGFNISSMPANGTAALDSADVWNRCVRERYHARTEIIEKINFVSGSEAFKANLANVSSDWQVDYIPFFSAYGHCYTIKPKFNVTMKTNANDSIVMVKVQPGIYKVMVHDQSVIPVGAGIQDSYRIMQKELVIPNNTLTNGTMQYALFGMKEKMLMIPRGVRKYWFGQEKMCRDNRTFHDNLQRAIIKQVGCQLSFHQWLNVSVAPYCKTKQDFNNYFQTTNAINQLSSLQISVSLGVPPLCSTRVIEAAMQMKKIITDFPGIYNRTGSSQTGNFLLFYYDSSRIQWIYDTHFYDGANLVGDLGGSLFLFVAVSIAHIIKVLRTGGKTLMTKKYI